MLIIITITVVTALFIIWYVLTQPTWQSNQSSSKTVSEKRLRQHVEVLSKRFHPRNWQSVDHLNKCASYIHKQFKEMGVDSVRYQPFVASGQTYKNVVALVGPESKERIVVGAHYDSFEITPGADDNASAVAVLLELARLLVESPPETTVELVAYTLEEPPFFASEEMGSAVHARECRKEGIDVRLMVCLEMVGYYSDEPDSQQYPMPLLRLFYPSKGNFIAIVGRLTDGAVVRRFKGLMRGTTDLPIYSINAPTAVPGVDFSDHRSYWEHGFNAIMLTDTAFYRNFQYHEVGDTAERLDYHKMGEVAVGVYEAVVGWKKSKE